ncbi:hypothetical protein [Alitabrizicola rongguiensis]|uniref:hypothetical protein n=1 Tax=Alitabrizicola rongguiensis TaxID=2909234 RepID=UPI001F1B8641|nr:hypothetical protein [Tabrizicola rongguiensis]
MSVILHIGQPKTGTTAIQNALVAQRDLLIKHGTLYPSPKHIPYVHHFLPVLIEDPDKIAQHTLNRMGFSPTVCKGMAREELALVRQQVDAVQPKQIILSSESMFRSFSTAKFDHLKQLLADLGDEVRVVAYLRNPADHYMSRAQQQLRNRAEIVSPDPNRTIGPLTAYRAAFGDAFECRVYDRKVLRDGDVIRDFWDYAGLDPNLMPSNADSDNSSISAEAMSVFLRINPPTDAKTPDEAKEHSRRRRAVLQADADLPGATKPRLRPEIRDYIIRSNTELLQQRDEFGLVFPGLDYSIVGQNVPTQTPTFSRIEELCELDPARRDALEARVRAELAPSWRHRLRQLVAH